MLGYPNAMQLEQNRINESQIMQLAQFLADNPDIANSLLSGTAVKGEDQPKEKSA
jgi:hypothetical protein